MTTTGTAPYYTEAFFPMPGRCFRLIARAGEGGPTHCPEPPTWRGSWRSPNGRRYRVEACEGHRPPADHGGGGRLGTLTRNAPGRLQVLGHAGGAVRP